MVFPQFRFIGNISTSTGGKCVFLYPVTLCYVQSFSLYVCVCVFSSTCIGVDLPGRPFDQHFKGVSDFVSGTTSKNSVDEIIAKIPFG